MRQEFQAEDKVTPKALKHNSTEWGYVAGVDNRLEVLSYGAE